MSHLILVRHSIVEHSMLGRGNDWPLSREGRVLCLRLADALRPFQPQVIVSSPMRRASETAEIIATCLGIESRTAAGLEEHRRPFVPGGMPEGDFDAAMRRFFASPAERVFGDESAAECRARFAAAIDAVLTSEPGRNVTIVSHGTAVALYAAPYFDQDPEALWRRIGWPSFMVVDPAAGRGLHLAASLAKRD